MSRRILLVDDDLAEIAAVRRVLQRAGHRALLATNVSDALAAVAAGLPDLALVASDCEGGDGAEVARRLAGEAVLRPVPVVLLGEPVPGVRGRALPRPVDATALEEEIHRALEAAPPPPALKPPAVAAAGPSLLDLTGHSPAAEAAALREAEAALQAKVTADPLPDPLPLRGRGGTSGARQSPGSPNPSPAPAKPSQTRAHAPARDEESPAKPARARAPAPGHDERGQESTGGGAFGAGFASRAATASESSKPGAPPPTTLVEDSPPDSDSTEDPDATPPPAFDQHLPPALLSGDGSALPAPRLLALAAASRATGRLDFLLDPPRALWLEDGQVVGAASDAPGERPLDVGRKLGLVTPAQHAALTPAAAGLGSRRVGVLLMEERLLEASDLSVLAGARAQEIVAAVLEGRAEHRFAPGAVVPASERLVMGGGTLALCVEGIRRRWGAPRIEAWLGGGDTLLAPGDGAGALGGMDLGPDEVLLARRADGMRTLDELLAASRLAAVEGRALLAALLELGVLAVAQRAEPGASRSRAAASDLARVEERLNLVRHADYFEILGVSRYATPHEIGVAADRLLLGLAPERFPGAQPDLVGKLEEIREVASEARDVLCDDRLRSDYARATEAGNAGP